MLNKGKKNYLNTSEFLERACISLTTLKRRIKSGEIEPIKEGNRLFFHYGFLPENCQEDFFRDRDLLPKKEETKEVRGYQDLKPWEKQVADKRENIIKELLAIIKDAPRGKVKEIKRHFGKQNGVSYQTLDRWASKYKKGGYYALVPNWNPGTQKKLIDKKIGKFIDNTYMKPFGPSKKETYELLIDQFAGKRDRLPSYESVVNYINSKWTKSQQVLVRNREEWDRLYSPHVRRDWSKVKLNEVWFGDAKQIDVACLFRGKAIFPWFTAFLDARSRKFVGYVLTPIHDSLAIAQAYAFGVSKHGVPKTIYIDRGKPYKSHLIAGTKVKKGETTMLFDGIDQTNISGILRECGTEVFYAAPYNAREKIIEPAFKVFTYRMRGLPGYRSHNTKLRSKKCEKDIKAKTIFTFEKLSKEVDRIIKERNNRPHSVTGKSPNSYYEGHNFAIPSQDLLIYLCMDVNTATVRDACVILKGLLYRNDELWRLSGERVEVRREPQDVQRAAIIYKGNLFCFAELETPSHYRDAITLESANTVRRTKKKVRKWRKKVIEHEGYIDDPIGMAVKLSEEEKIRARDIRPASSKVRSLHKNEKLAKQVVSGFKQPEAEVEKEALAAGGDGGSGSYKLTFPLKKQVRGDAPEWVPTFPLTINDDFEED